MGSNTNAKTTFVLGNKLYDFMKKLVLVILPAISSAYFALSGIWGFPNPEAVVGTIAVITTFLGVTLHVSSANYVSSGAAYDGTVAVTPVEGGSTVKVNVDPSDLVTKDVVHLQVVPPSK